MCVNMKEEFINLIKKQLKFTIDDTNFNIGPKYKGKVRDVYDLNDKLLIIATDRISAFDKVIGLIPFKGEILTSLSLFWFEKTADIIKNHILEVVHSNAVLVKKCNIIPIEIIVRGYLTGGGWREYSKTGSISGIKLPKGLKKDSKFEKPILTPTTKAKEGHDESISKDEILKRNIVSLELFNKIEDTAIKIFNRGIEIAKKNNLILVDTKYEFGLFDDGSLMLADEIHTQDSSRYWYLDTYEDLFQKGKEQRMLDKEYFRQWLLDNNFSGNGNPPEIPLDIIVEVCNKYIKAYETITGNKYILKNADSKKELMEKIGRMNFKKDLNENIK